MLVLRRRRARARRGTTGRRWYRRLHSARAWRRLLEPRTSRDGRHAMRFKDKVAFITGGGRGIGETYARALAAEGAAVVLAEIDVAAAQSVAASIAQSGARALALECDVADENSVEAAVARAAEHFGGIDILINNAAKHLTEFAGKPTELPRA